MRRVVLLCGLGLQAALAAAAPPNPFVAPAMDMPRGVPPQGGGSGLPPGMGTIPQNIPPAGPPPSAPEPKSAPGGGLENELQGRLRQSIGALEVLAVLDSQAMLSLPVASVTSSVSGAPAAGFNPSPIGAPPPASGNATSASTQKRRTWVVRHMRPTTLIGQRVLPVIDSGVLTLYLIESGPDAKNHQAVIDSGVVVFSGGVDASGATAKTPSFVAEDPKVAERIRRVLSGGGTSAAAGGQDSATPTPNYSAPLGVLR